MRITSKGQVTIPVELREKTGLLPATEVRFEMAGNALLLKKIGTESRRGRELITRMRGKATRRMTTAQIMALTRDS